jgi:cytochrome b pre-mRNA-processing protein 3
VILRWIKRALQANPPAKPDATAEAVLFAARVPGFYTDLGVPDTFDGRFELVSLHYHLLLRRLRAEGEPGVALSQGVFDYITAHFDEALREIGVGDMSVGKRVKTMTQAFYGRMTAYDAGFEAEAGDAGETQTLAGALQRNLYGTVTDIDEAWVAQIVCYQHAATAHLATLDLATITQGQNLFPALTG